MYHYTDYMDASYFDESLQSVDALMADYAGMETSDEVGDPKYSEEAMQQYLNNLKQKYSWTFQGVE